MHLSLGKIFKKDGLYNTYQELLFKKWIVQKSQFEAS